uniref:Large ribosomal subunit protein bL28c n=2 Tax=Opuntia streptacantha TaxID=393608 RepID=A0A7C9DVB2_OPUST
MAASSAMLLSNPRSVCIHKPQFSSLSSLKTKPASELGFITSQFSGLKLSTLQPLTINNPISTQPRPRFQPVARRVCPFTGKKSNRANQISASNHKTKKLQFVNLQYKKLWWEAGKRFVKLRLSTKALKTIEKNGLDEVAKKAGIDLSKE